MPAFPALLQVRGCWGTERAAICSAGSAAQRHADGEGADHVSEVSGRQRRHACLAGARGAGRGSDACGGGDRGWARGAAPAGVDECGNTPAFGATMGRPMIADATGPTGGRHADSPCAEKRPRGCLVRTSVPRERPRRFAPSFTESDAPMSLATRRIRGRGHNAPCCHGGTPVTGRAAGLSNHVSYHQPHLWGCVKAALAARQRTAGAEKRLRADAPGPAWRRRSRPRPERSARPRASRTDLAGNKELVGR
jgi:hypothetical protein